jgi:hypothetical protein
MKWCHAEESDMIRDWEVTCLALCLKQIAEGSTDPQLLAKDCLLNYEMRTGKPTTLVVGVCQEQ